MQLVTILRDKLALRPCFRASISELIALIRALADSRTSRVSLTAAESVGSRCSCCDEEKGVVEEEEEEVGFVFFTFLLVVVVMVVVVVVIPSPSSPLPLLSPPPSPPTPPPRLGNLAMDEWAVSTTPRCFAAFWNAIADDDVVDEGDGAAMLVMVVPEVLELLRMLRNTASSMVKSSSSSRYSSTLSFTISSTLLSHNDDDDASLGGGSFRSPSTIATDLEALDVGPGREPRAPLDTQ